MKLGGGSPGPEDHKSSKEFGRVEEVVRGTAPRDANLVPSETSCRHNCHGRKMASRDKLHHLMALGLLKFTSECFSRATHVKS